MPLSCNEIKTRATTFSKEWKNTQRGLFYSKYTMGMFGKEKKTKKKSL